MPKRISSQLLSITTLLRYGLTKRFANFFHFKKLNMPGYESYQSEAPKPDKNCRTCTDFKFWSKQQRNLSSKPQDSKSSNATHINSKSDSNLDKPQRSDCPLDKSTLGSSTWGLMHSIAAFFPDEPTNEQKQNVITFFDSLSKVYPCDYCARDFRKDFNENPINVDSQKELALWLCRFHNRVNKKLGKPEFDCCKTNERWRDGWLDGSCD